MPDFEDGARGANPEPIDGGREPTIEERIRDGEPIITEEDILEDIAALDRREAARRGEVVGGGRGAERGDDGAARELL